jgi:hypothetical protein
VSHRNVRIIGGGGTGLVAASPLVCDVTRWPKQLGEFPALSGFHYGCNFTGCRKTKEPNTLKLMQPMATGEDSILRDANYQ